MFSCFLGIILALTYEIKIRGGYLFLRPLDYKRSRFRYPDIQERLNCCSLYFFYVRILPLSYPSRTHLRPLNDLLRQSPATLELFVSRV